MINPRFAFFLGALRQEMTRAGRNPEDLEADQSGTRARLPGIRSPEWYLIEQEHVDLAPREQDPGLAREWIAEEATVVLEVYLQDA